MIGVVPGTHNHRLLASCKEEPVHTLIRTHTRTVQYDASSMIQVRPDIHPSIHLPVRLFAHAHTRMCDVVQIRASERTKDLPAHLPARLLYQVLSLHPGSGASYAWYNVKRGSMERDVRVCVVCVYGPCLSDLVWIEVHTYACIPAIPYLVSGVIVK